MTDLVIRKTPKVDGTEGYICFLETPELLGLSKKTEKFIATSKEDVLKLLGKI